MSPETGTVVNHVDGVNRVTVPVAWLRKMGVRSSDNVELAFDGQTVTVRAQHPRCLVCGGRLTSLTFSNRKVCAFCAGSILEEATVHPGPRLPMTPDELLKMAWELRA